MKTKKQIEPKEVEIEWEGKKYTFPVEKIYNAKEDQHFYMSRGYGAYPDREIFIPRWFCCRSIDELKNLLNCGFKNQKVDAERREKTLFTHYEQ